MSMSDLIRIHTLTYAERTDTETVFSTKRVQIKICAVVRWYGDNVKYANWH